MKVVKILKHYKYTVLFAISALLYFQPGRYVMGNTLGRLWNYSLMAVSILYAALYLQRFRYAEIKKSDIGVGLLVGAHVYCMLVASLMNPATSNLKNAVLYTVSMVGFTAFVRTGLFYNPKALLQGYLITGVIQCLINLATMVLYHSNGGMRKGISVLGRDYSDNWFYLGHANATFFITLPVVALLFIYSYHFNKGLVKYCWAMMAAVLAIYYFQYSLAGLLGFVAFTSLLLMDELLPTALAKRICRALNLRVLLVAALIMESFLAVMTGLSNYSDFLYGTFAKGQSIQARLRIWSNAEQYIINRIWLGNGLNTDEIAVLRLTNTHTHNILLEFLYCGGALAVFLFIAAVLYLQNYLDKYGAAVYQSKAFRTAIWALAPFILGATFDYYIYRNHQLFLYIILWHLPAWVRKENFEINECADQRQDVKPRRDSGPLQ